MRLLFASTVPETIDHFMRGQLAWIASQGHEVHVVSSPGTRLEAVHAREGVSIHPVLMQREISPMRDAKALTQWIGVVRELRPDVVVVSTPKAGLLGGVAAWLLRVPRRVYLLRGARFEGERGVKGAVLRATERVACATAHRVIAVSPSLANLAVDAGVVPARKLATVGAGSSNGVDVDRFHVPDTEERSAARARWRLAQDDIGVVFVGRLHVDKGVDVLREALAVLESTDSGLAVLLVAGSDEGAVAELPSEGDVRVRMLGQVDDVPDLLRAADILVLPTRREGFPNVVLEAAASGLPVVTTDATGAVDSVVDGETGYVVAKADGRAFGLALSELVRDPALRQSFGIAARERAEREFRRESVWEGMYREYLGTGQGAIRLEEVELRDV